MTKGFLKAEEVILQFLLGKKRVDFTDKFESGVVFESLNGRS